MAEYRTLLDEFDRYMKNGAGHWFKREHADFAGPVAYFCAEYGLNEVARHLLGRAGRARRRSSQGRLGHGHSARRRRPLLSPRLLPPDDRRRRSPGARLPQLRSRATAAAPRDRHRRRPADDRRRAARPDDLVRRLAGPGRPRAAAPARHRYSRQRHGRPADHAHPLRPRPRDAPAPGDGPRRGRRARPARAQASSPRSGISTRATRRSCSSSGCAR